MPAVVDLEEPPHPRRGRASGRQRPVAGEASGWSWVRPLRTRPRPQRGGRRCGRHRPRRLGAVSRTGQRSFPHSVHRRVDELGGARGRPPRWARSPAAVGVRAVDGHQWPAPFPSRRPSLACDVDGQGPTKVDASSAQRLERENLRAAPRGEPRREGASAARRPPGRPGGPLSVLASSEVGAGGLRGW
jgi:hypothetical protein